MIKDKQTMRRIFALQCRICKAVSHPLRLEVVDLLKRGEMSAATLLAALETSKANLSKHTHQLIQAGSADQRRDGRHVYYRLTRSSERTSCCRRSPVGVRWRTSWRNSASPKGSRQAEPFPAANLAYQSGIFE